MGTPPRRPGSVRRTSSVDMLRPDGPDGPLVLRGAGRDLHTGTDGRARVLAAAAAIVTVDFSNNRIVTGIGTDPPADWAGSLVGIRAGSGFRAVLDAAAPASARGGLLGLLLDEVPVTTLISRAALSDEGEDNGLPSIDVCSGWIAGGRLAESVTLTNRLPPLARPEAPDLADPADPIAWHDQPPLPAGSMRRVRRLDVAPAGGEAWTVETFFRDSLMHPVEGHIVVHEYSVVATVDGPTQWITGMQVDARVLPAPECPAAVDSAARLVGRALPDVRRLVSAAFSGTSTCTHLNDQLRALGDMGALMEAH